MHYILKLPGTVAQVVDYPTSSPAFFTYNEASAAASKLDMQGRKAFERMTQLPLDMPLVFHDMPQVA